MATDVTPALSDDEWERFRSAIARPHAFTTPQAMDHALGRNEDDPPEMDELRARFAMWNASLPDDDARRITREDVQILRIAATGGMKFSGLAEPQPDIELAQGTLRLLQDDIRRIADKIAALLPPE